MPHPPLVPTPDYRGMRERHRGRPTPDRAHPPEYGRPRSGTFCDSAVVYREGGAEWCHLADGGLHRQRRGNFVSRPVDLRGSSFAAQERVQIADATSRAKYCDEHNNLPMRRRRRSTNGR